MRGKMLLLALNAARRAATCLRCSSIIFGIAFMFAAIVAFLQTSDDKMSSAAQDERSGNVVCQ